MKIGKIVKVIGGNNEIGQPTMIGKIGLITNFGNPYYIKGKPTRAVFVDFKHFGQHIFNDYHLELLNINIE